MVLRGGEGRRRKRKQRGVGRKEGETRKLGKRGEGGEGEEEEMRNGRGE